MEQEGENTRSLTLLVVWYAFKVPFMFFWALVSGLFGLKRIFPRLYQAGHSLAFRSSLQLQTRSYLLSLRFLFSALKAIWQKGETLSRFSGTHKTCIFDGTERSIEIRREYLRRFLGFDSDFLLSTGRLLFGYNFWHRLFATWLMLGFGLPYLLILGLFPRWRARVLSYNIEMIQAYNLILLLKRNRIEKLYYFCIFEKDSQFNGLLLKTSGVGVYKFTSETPISFYNRSIIANEVIFCHPYQVDEWPVLSPNMYAESYRLWVPEQTFLHLDIYQDSPEASTNTLAIYTAGAWFRKQRGDIEQGFGYYEAEAMFFEALKSYLKLRPEIEILVFTHPLERATPERFEEAKAIYGDLLGANRIRFSEGNIRTANAFHRAEVAVAVFSSVLWDRLFCGYKTLFAPMSMPDFPIDDSPVRQICAANQVEFIKMLDQAFDLKEKDWFRELGLEDYCDWEVLQTGGIKYEKICVESLPSLKRTD